MKELFYNRQNDLLWIANSPVGRKLLHCELDFPIIQVFSHSYRMDTKELVYKNKKIHKVLIDRFFTSNRVAELFIPVLAQLDLYKELTSIIDPYKALLHFSGFETQKNYPTFYLVTTTFNPNAINFGSGRLQSGSSNNFTTVRNGNSISYIASISQLEDAFTGGNYILDRDYTPYDTSSLPDNAVISSSFIRYTGNAGTTDTDSFALFVVKSTQSDMTNLVTGDWTNIGSTSFGTITAASWNASGSNDITLNTSGIANISLTGTSGFCAIGNRDFNNSAPTGVNILGFTSTNDMLLSVTYTLPLPNEELNGNNTAPLSTRKFYRKEVKQY